MPLKKLLLLAGLCFPLAVLGQVDHYPVDTTSKTASKSLPFDRPFILDFRGKNAESIWSGVIFEWKINGNKRTLKISNDTLVNQRIPPENVFNAKGGKDVYIPGQAPNNNFAIMLAHHFDGKLLEDILEANLLLAINKHDKADKILHQLDKKVEEQIMPIPGIDFKHLKATSFFASGWLNDTTILIKTDRGKKDIFNKIVQGYTQFFNSKLKGIYDSLKLITTDPSIDITMIRPVTLLADALKVNITALNPLNSVTINTQLSKVLSGEIALKERYQPITVKESNFPGRLANLDISVANLEEMIRTLDNLIARSSAVELTMLKSKIEALQNNCKLNADTLEKKYKEIKSHIDSNDNLTYQSWAMGNNEIWDLKTAGSYQVIPDIGVATIYAIGNIKNETIVRPYVGASIYLRPVDKNVPFKYFDRDRWLHQLSFNFGVSLSNTEQGEFSGFFNSMNLLLGLNCKILRPLSVSGGVAFMKRKNVNPAIDRKDTVVNPYLALTFDLDFMSTIQKLTGNFIK